ncbi:MULTISPECIES: tol-pal system-associated acyl-CoA thioesterase [unclassified Methylosinus]|uniref:tol-pal system-associated acyl-CoA thioesterase n=1 Tax=unclassified Methylosinus TaxID=2624500 RepID=UPI0003658397|nr:MULTISPECIES: tol-pal system-associated acyl-CoA thioesterase [unclassified Methylosinus]
MTHTHTLAVRVYYEDTDFSGLVYHASYLRFMERGRTELLRDLGLGQRELLEAQGGLFFVVRALTIDFRKPAQMDDSLIVETIVREVSGASFDLDQRVMRGEEPLVSAQVRIAAVEGGRPRRMPADVRAKFLSVASPRGA